MGMRQKLWARRTRDKLKETLGSACKRCGKTENLEFDCIRPAGDFHHKLDAGRRTTFYVRQWRSGNLQLLCAKCHNLKSLGELPEEFGGPNEAQRRAIANEFACPETPSPTPTDFGIACTRTALLSPVNNTARQRNWRYRRGEQQ